MSGMGAIPSTDGPGRRAVPLDLEQRFRDRVRPARHGLDVGSGVSGILGRLPVSSSATVIIWCGGTSAR